MRHRLSRDVPAVPPSPAPSLLVLRAASRGNKKTPHRADFPFVGMMMARAMSCGDGVPLCGVLALVTGLGSGVQNVTGGAVYGHPIPIVHGIWPQTPPFGNSDCVAPSASSANATRIYSCYQCIYPGDTNCSSIPHHSPAAFQDHEWSKHGVCAGVRGAEDYFTQTCALAAPPLQVLSAARSAGTTSLNRFKVLLEAAAPDRTAAGRKRPGLTQDPLSASPVQGRPSEDTRLLSSTTRLRGLQCEPGHGRALPVGVRPAYRSVGPRANVALWRGVRPRARH